MSDVDPNAELEPEGAAPGQGEGESEEASPPPQTWGGPSQDEWNTVVGGLQYIASKFFDEDAAQGNQPPSEEDLKDMDVGSLVQMYVDGRLGEVQPYVEAAARDAGEKRMNELFDHFEKEPEIGKFDRNYASKLAESIYAATGDPVESVRQAAMMTANFSKAERKAALEEYKAAAKKTPFSDPSVTGGGERSAPTAKTYDEVIERWAGQEDV